MNYSKKHLNRYYTFCIILFSIYIFILVFSLFLDKPLLTILISALLYYPLTLSIRLFSIKNFSDILSSEKNSRKFYDTIHHRPLRPPLLYRLHAEWYIGNYEKLILLAQASYKTSKSIRMKITSLVFLARAYFELHNIDRLKEVTDTFFELEKANSKKKKFFSNYKIFHFYKSFIDENYAKCMEFVDDQLNHLDTRKQKDELRWLTQQSNRAICFYWQGNKQKAKELFEQFKSNSPNLANFNGLADKYLLAIENDDSSILNISVYDNTDINDFEYQFLALRTKKKKKKIIFSILLLIVLGVLTSLEIKDYKDRIESQSRYENDIIEYENDLKIAITKKYGNANFIKYFNITDGTQHIDSFCLVEHGDRLDLTSIVTYDGGESLDLIILIEDIQIPNDYSVKSAVSNNQIEFYISNEQLPTSIDKELIEFSLNNRNYWIEIQSITPLT